MEDRRQVLNAALHAHSLVYATCIEQGHEGRDLSWHDLDAALASGRGIVWIHLNAADAHARSWIENNTHIPTAAQAIMLDADDRQRVDKFGTGICGVISDVHYGFDFDPDQIATLRFYLNSRCLISTRLAPLNATDRLRKSVRQGVQFNSTLALMATLFDFQVEMLNDIVARVGKDLSVVEDDVLKGSIADQRGELGRMRRLAVRLYRHFNPGLRTLRRLIARPPAWVEETDAAALQETIEDLAVVVDDLLVIQERAKLLQEELASRVAEETNRSLYVLSMVTAVMLPVTLITGIFGMNVAGLPGLNDPQAFTWVVVSMVVVAVIAILLLQKRRF